MEAGRYGRRGSPWEFNLRDVFRWCELMLREQHLPSTNSGGGGTGVGGWEPWLLVDTLYIQRMRTRGDREAILARFREAFPEAFRDCSLEESSSPCTTGGGDSGEGLRAGIGTHPVLRMTPEWMQVGRTVLPRGCWTAADGESRAGGEGGGGTGGVDELPAGLTMPLALRRPLQALARYECQPCYYLLLHGMAW